MIGPQSLQQWLSSVFTSQVGTTYKANLDAGMAIASEPIGQLYVYPNNPTALSVLVDPAFNLIQVGQSGPLLLNGAASPITVSLTVPGANSYYATICWNPTSNTASVIYGATAVSPTPVLPDNPQLIPLSLVLLTVGQSQVIATNMADIRSLITRPVPTLSSLGSVSTAQSVACYNASEVSADLTITAGVTLTLANLQYGVSVFVSMAVGSGTQTFKMAATTPGGVNYAIKAIVQGSPVVDMVGTGITSGAISTYFSGTSQLISGTPTLRLQAVQS